MASIETRIIREELQKIFERKNLYEIEAANLRAQKELDASNYDRLAADKADRQIRIHNNWIKGLDDAIADLEKLFQIIEEAEQHE